VVSSTINSYVVHRCLCLAKEESYARNHAELPLGRPVTTDAIIFFLNEVPSLRSIAGNDLRQERAGEVGKVEKIIRPARGAVLSTSYSVLGHGGSENCHLQAAPADGRV
jgi:hypothetical protein